MPAVADPVAALTLASIHADFVAWHRGRRRYALWAIAADIPALRDASARLRAHADGYLLAGYRRQPHVTLHLCGFPSSGGGRGGDHYGGATLRRQLRALAAARVPPFAIEIGSPDTFAAAAYLAVDDDTGGIARIRRALGGGGAAEGPLPYTPHLTVGLYRGQFPLAEVRAHLRACPGLSPVRLAVTRVALMTYETAVIGGPLASIGEFDLAARSWHPLDAGALPG